MRKTELPRVQHLTRMSGGGSRAVKLVAEQRVADVLEVDANLVRPPGVQPALDERRAAEDPDDTVFCFCRAAARGIHDGHFLAMNRMPPDGCFDHAFFLLEAALRKGEIDF